MKQLPGKDQIAFYRDNGFVVIEDFLAPDELDHWRQAVMQAVAERGGRKIPGRKFGSAKMTGSMKTGIITGRFLISC